MVIIGITEGGTAIPRELVGAPAVATSPWNPRHGDGSIDSKLASQALSTTRSDHTRGKAYTTSIIQLEVDKSFLGTYRNKTLSCTTRTSQWESPSFTRVWSNGDVPIAGTCATCHHQVWIRKPIYWREETVEVPRFARPDSSGCIWILTMPMPCRATSLPQPWLSEVNWSRHFSWRDTECEVWMQLGPFGRHIATQKRHVWICLNTLKLEGMKVVHINTWYSFQVSSCPF